MSEAGQEVTLLGADIGIPAPAGGGRGQKNGADVLAEVTSPIAPKMVRRTSDRHERQFHTRRFAAYTSSVRPIRYLSAHQPPRRSSATR